MPETQLAKFNNHWLTVEEFSGNAHLIPIDDLKAHIQSAYCKCKPETQRTERNTILIVHYSYNGREFFGTN